MMLRDLNIDDTVKGDEDGPAGALDLRLICRCQAYRGRVRKSRLRFVEQWANELLSAPDFLLKSGGCTSFLKSPERARGSLSPKPSQPPKRWEV
jgi:hypothetical protein